MLSGNELQAVDTFIVGKLRGDATLAALVGTNVFTDLAPQGTPFPYIIVQFLSSVDRNAIPADARMLTRALYLVKAVTQADGFGAAHTIANRIDTVLVGQEGVVGAVKIGCIYRDELVRYVEAEEGRRINHLGGRYRSEISAA